MKMKGITFAVLAVMSLSVVAGGSRHGPQNKAYGGKAYGGQAKAYGGKATSKAYGGNATSKAYGGRGGSAAAFGGNQKQGQVQGQVLNAGQSLTGSQSQDSSNNGVSINDSHDYSDIPVSTAYAPPVMVTAPCAIGVSGGGQASSFGVSIGTYYIDSDCVLNRDVALYSSLGAAGLVKSPHELIHATLCQKESFKTAAATIADLECPTTKQKIKVMPATYKTCHVADEDCRN